MSDSAAHAVLEAAYDRLVSQVENRPVTPEHLKSAALEALARAKDMIEKDPDWMARELDRITAISAQEAEDEAALIDG